MEGSRFDTITQSLGAGTTRRGVLGLVAAAAGLTLDAAAAKNRGRKRRQRVKNEANGSSAVCKAAGSRTCDRAGIGPGRNLSRCDFSDGPLVGANLSSANASGASFAGAHLLAANLASANLGNACFAGASLRTANLRGANAGGADFSGVDLCGADLRGAKITSTQIASARTVCCNTRLPNGKPALPCAAGKTCCGSLCTDVRHDSGNCGACGNDCPSGKICCGGRCVDPHPGGRCGLGDPDCLSPSTDLQQAFDNARDHATIHLCAGTWDLTDTILIDKNLSIFGPTSGGTILNGQSANQVVGIRPNISVIIGNVTITQGEAEEGAGIFNQGNLGLYDCQVTENKARLGGGIYNEGSLYLYDTTISHNAVTKSSSVFTPDYDGGGIYNDDGEVVVYDGTVITDNTANDRGQEFGEGGGIYNYYGSLTVNSGGQLTSNHASTHGGGISNLLGNLTLQTGSAVSGNVTAGTGGGLYDFFDCCDDHTVTIGSRSIITGNTPDNCAGDPSFTTNCVG